MARYTINGIQVPGVTSILDLLDKGPAIIQWAVNNAVLYIDKHFLEYTSEEDFQELLTMAKFKYRQMSKEALDIGSQVHDIISQYITARINNEVFDPTQYNDYRDEVENGFLAFLDWEKNNIIEYIESEQPVCSLKYYYAGTLDCIARLKDNKIYVIDFKSSKSFYDGYAKQIASYRYARTEEKPDNRFLCKFVSDAYNYEKDII